MFPFNSWHHIWENITSFFLKNITKWNAFGDCFFLSFLQFGFGPRILLIELPQVIVVSFTDVIYQHFPPPLAIPLSQQQQIMSCNEIFSLLSLLTWTCPELSVSSQSCQPQRWCPSQGTDSALQWRRRGLSGSPKKEENSWNSRLIKSVEFTSKISFWLFFFK